MNETIKERISSLRKEMELNGVQAYYISGTDPHLNEYLPARWEIRSFISGFTGSAGLVIVTTECAALWTDSRYFLQAADQLQGTGIELMKQRVAGTPEPTDWLSQILKDGDTVGADFSCLSISQYKQLTNNLSPLGLKLKNTGDLVDQVWKDRPSLPEDKIFEHDLLYAGTKRIDKIAEVLKFVRSNGADSTLVAALDDLAWTFNLRGNDIEYNPVFVGYAYISENENILFANPKKMTDEVANKLKEEGIEIKNYTDFFDFLSYLKEGITVVLDPSKTNQAVREAIPGSVHVIEQTSIPCLLKAQKSTFEIIHVRETMKKDGVAMVNFLYWLNEQVGRGQITEYDVALKLGEFRAQQEGFQGISFHPIVGLNGNGAIVHRSVTKETAAEIRQEGILLFDSGGQYLGGTTDITRTVALSEPTDRQKSDFTLVLKGMIGLSLLQFPTGTVGSNLDVAARMPLWKNHLNYGHGTGHGIGYFLNVHEGPMSIRQEYNEQTIKPGMVISNEPGLYREGEYGIRIENVIVCMEMEEPGFGRFLGFETLTLCPIDRKLIASELLNKDELEWLNAYHQLVFDELSSLLDTPQSEFLKKQTEKIQ